MNFLIWLTRGLTISAGVSHHASHIWKVQRSYNNNTALNSENIINSHCIFPTNFSFSAGWLPMRKPAWFAANRQTIDNQNIIKHQTISLTHSSTSLNTDIIPALQQNNNMWVTLYCIHIVYRDCSYAGLYQWWELSQFRRNAR